MDKKRLTAAGVLTGIVFGAGFVSLLLIPGLGGTSKTTNFTDFYNSSGHRATANILAFVLLVGSWLMIWFFTELRGQGAASVRSDLAYRLSIVGATAVIVGTAIELGPLMVQNNSDNGSFVGSPSPTPSPRRDSGWPPRGWSASRSRCSCTASNSAGPPPCQHGSAS